MMTKKEAIRILKECEAEGEDWTALQIAISALEEQVEMEDKVDYEKQENI